MEKDTGRAGEARPPARTTTPGGGVNLDGELRPWSPPALRVLPLDMTGGGGGAPGNEHTPHSYNDPVRGDPPPPES